MTEAPHLPDTARGAGAAWRASVTLAIIAIVGEPLPALVEARELGARLNPILRLLHVGEAVILLALILTFRRRQITQRLGTACYLALVLPLFPIFWISEITMAASGRPWSPFGQCQIGMVGSAILAPGRVVAASVIVGFGAEALVLAPLLRRLATGNEIAVNEPVQTVVYAFIAIGMLAYRVHMQAVERAYVQKTLEAESLARVARAFQAVRDLTNTPLQSLHFGVELIERGHAGSKVIACLRAALRRLDELSHSLAGTERAVPWRPGDENLDARAILRELGGATPPTRSSEADRGAGHRGP